MDITNVKQDILARIKNADDTHVGILAEAFETLARTEHDMRASAEHLKQMQIQTKLMEGHTCNHSPEFAETIDEHGH